MSDIRDDQPGTTFDDVELDERTTAWLMDLSEEKRVPPKLLIAAILRDVANDDRAEHEAEFEKIQRARVAPGNSTVN